MSAGSRAPAIGAALLAALLLAHAVPATATAPESKPPRVKRPGPLTAPPVFHALADVPEVEPNDSAAQAQVVDCGNSLSPASITDVAAVPDTDWISFTVDAGDYITLETTGKVPTDSTDTVIDLIAADSVTVLATNDDAGPTTPYSRIADFAAPYTGLYFGRIRGFQGVSPSEGPYRANVTCLPPPPPPANDQCAGAILIPEGNVDLNGDLRSAADDYELCTGEPLCPGSCTGFDTPGKDIVFRLEPANAGDLLDLTYTLTPQDADASLYLVTDCGDVADSCVAGQDSDAGYPPERLQYTFPAVRTYYLILDAFVPSGTTWTLTGCMRCSTPVLMHTWGSIKTIYR